ncbi:SrfA family protein [Dickeya solani]|uniref:SrfA family protein n=1 Tax=Dickeya solani TaxID=1089444 RepID=A0ABU4EJZ9_9GAMM|nr:SrfA family protein [Dickeya solani]MCA6999745.1 SrfA family protein [Dickeya solani]MCZ0820310.1 SrfA family protein [Dickeya solani]MDV6993956.1 SrfA family protein [Dickeya solani]MDV7005312.1 SrfA family protein [Dickeya solani]MDV7039129.1 SrfA family protein [Dickeya solani]
MSKTFLRSGELAYFLPLGENGQAVYVSALQLRETLRLRQYQAVADCLSMPQSNERGDRIDWYTSIDGAVVPWAQASDEARREALAYLEDCHRTLLDVSAKMRSMPGYDQQLFGALLEKTVQFPDSSHVYLVNDKPVITFWGFINRDESIRPEPLDCLKVIEASIAASPDEISLPVPPQPAVSSPESPPVSGASSPSSPNASSSTGNPRTVDSTDTSSRRYRVGFYPWRRYLPGWLPSVLLLMLLALLLMWLLRSCVPAGLSGLPALSSLSSSLPDFARDKTPTVRVPDVAEAPLSPTMSIASDTAMAPSGVGQIVPPTLPTPESATSEAALKPSLPDVDVAPSLHPSVSPKPVVPSHAESAMQQTIDTMAATLSPLTMPDGAANTNDMDFLNGNWRAGAGIQDKRTGVPLRLHYEIHNGAGQVEMKRGDGVLCRSAIRAAMSAGQLTITSQGMAQCSDGSTYQMPDVICRPGARSIADCSGRYDARTVFPMTMKQEGK